jgi:hypothetical protein
MGTDNSEGFRHGLIHLLNGSTSVPVRPRRNETGHPCRFPVSVDSGVLISACASTWRSVLP